MKCKMRLDPASSDEGQNREESESSMRRGKAMHQKSMQMELALGSRGEAPRDQSSGEAGRAAQGKERSGSHDLMERVVVRANAVKAFKRVRRNKGSPALRDRLSLHRTRLVAPTLCCLIVEDSTVPASTAIWEPFTSTPDEVPRPCNNPRGAHRKDLECRIQYA